MSRYQINENDIKFAEEFKNNLYQSNYYHSPSLQKILNLFRSGQKKGKYVVVKLNNKNLWYLGSLPKRRGQKIKIYTKIYFKNFLDAEWYVFKKRWKYHSGKTLRIKNK